MIVPASAADVNTYESAFDGFYFGAHGGYAWADTEIDYSGNYGASGSGPSGSGSFDGSTDLSSQGALLGAQLGANFVMGNGFLLGAEISGSWTAISNDESFDDGDVSIDIEQNISALGLAQAKLGYAHESFAFYVMGGLALGKSEIEANLSSLGFDVADVSQDEMLTGWTLGAGADFMVTENVSVGISYNYVDFGTVSDSQDISRSDSFYWVFGELDTDTSINMHVAKATLNYHF